MNLSSPNLHRLAERLAILEARYGFVRLDAERFPTFIAEPGHALILFTEDPAKVPETWDMTVILPEIVTRLPQPPRVGVLGPEAARALAARYGIRIWPALLALRDGAFLGTIEGLKDWSVYGRLVPEMLAAPPSRPPGIGIPVHNANATATCH